MDKQAFITLAQGYIDQQQLEDELYGAIKSINKKHHQNTDFVGLASQDGPAEQAILEAFAPFDKDDWFSYFVYDCNCDYDKFNERVTLQDGTHPNVNSLGDLYDFITEG